MARVLVGPADGPGVESFDLIVCDVAWIAQQVDSDRVLDGRHHLIVDGFNWPTIARYIELRVHSVEGRSWSDLATKVGRMGHWEFEDYRPSPEG